MVMCILLLMPMHPKMSFMKLLVIQKLVNYLQIYKILLMPILLHYLQIYKIFKVILMLILIKILIMKLCVIHQSAHYLQIYKILLMPMLNKMNLIKHHSNKILTDLQRRIIHLEMNYYNKFRTIHNSVIIIKMNSYKNLLKMLQKMKKIESPFNNQLMPIQQMTKPLKV